MDIEPTETSGRGGGEPSRGLRRWLIALFVSPRSPAGQGRSWLPIAGVVAATWAMLPRFAGPELNTSDRLEIADHVVPGAVLLVVAVAALAVGRHTRISGVAPPATLLFVSGLVVVLAGLWMTATHVPLLVQASRNEVTWGAAFYHSAPGIAVLVLGLVWAAAYWSDAPSAEANQEI